MLDVRRKAVEERIPVGEGRGVEEKSACSVIKLQALCRYVKTLLTESLPPGESLVPGTASEFLSLKSKYCF